MIEYFGTKLAANGDVQGVLRGYWNGSGFHSFAIEMRLLKYVKNSSHHYTFVAICLPLHPHLKLLSILLITTRRLSSEAC